MQDVQPCSRADIGPGDLLFFPPLWAHYTESVSPGPSGLVVSFGSRLRVQQAAQEGSAGAGDAGMQCRVVQNEQNGQD